MMTPRAAAALFDSLNLRRSDLEVLRDEATRRLADLDSVTKR